LREIFSSYLKPFIKEIEDNIELSSNPNIRDLLRELKEVDLLLNFSLQEKIDVIRNSIEQSFDNDKCRNERLEAARKRMSGTKYQ
jgi:transcriptional antiterminator